MTHPLYTGSMPALVTPFRNGDVDYDCFAEFVDWQIEEGSSALVPCGTTGESPTLTHSEHKRVVEKCIEAAEGRVPVIAGAGSNSTAEAIDFTQHAEASGADAALVVTPYYNKPNQEGMYQHFKAVHDASSLPILIYNIPGRSVVDMNVETMARLADDCPRIVGVKDASNDLTRPAVTRLAIKKGFTQVSGEDGTILPFMAQGGHGCISVTANVAPALCAEFQRAWHAGEHQRAEEINDRLMPLHAALFSEPSPQPVKYALSLLGKLENELRLPLIPVTEHTKTLIREAMVSAGLLK
ncbi:4-hydroxy-tetrahydrodipicolinate synthase [Fodinicurvata halophila]|uniref:4-hydroxy-tetrahydrodipicolinate synthase n=1 Tax=Fodinicurvata halophila TaxID=1419723 RepID=A0ABV8UKB8_9PROT